MQPKPTPALAAAAGTWSSYPGVVSLSLGFTLALAGALLVCAELAGLRFQSGLLPLRNFLGYGHFTLAYIFTWRLLCRQLGRRGAWTYLGLFLALVGLYAAAQRWWVPGPINDLFMMCLFMTHHASNEVLFRQQTRNGYQPFDWTTRRILWVALAVWLVALDRWGLSMNPWRATLPLVAGVWAVGWLVYGWLYLRPPRGSRWGVAGWVLAGILGIACAVHPTGDAVFAVRHRFAWLVIYHYVIWYVFYTSKLVARTGRWSGARQPMRSLPAVWKVATTVPLGFLGLVAAGNAVILAIFFAVDPIADWVTATTRLDFFDINTFAHIMFGVGISRAARPAPAVPPPRAASEQVPQFA